MTTPHDARPGRLLTRDEDLRALLARTRSIAVLGIKTEGQASQPAFYVPEAAKLAGYRILPVPVYYPEATEILGESVHRSVTAIGEPVDLVDVFRRPADLAGHLGDLLSARPRAVWLQSGIRDDAFAAQLVEAGIDVVQDRCLMVEIQRFGSTPPSTGG